MLKSDAVSAIKQLTGGDMMTADIKFMPRVKFFNTCKLLYATNHPILLSENDDAFFDRLVVIPFLISIPREKMDSRLMERFESEKLGIVMTALHHYELLKARNYIFSGGFKVNDLFHQSADSVSPTETVFNGEMQVETFVRQYCQLVPADHGRTLTVNLYEAYCNAFVSSPKILELPVFSKTLANVFSGIIFPHRWREDNRNPQRGFEGIVLNPCRCADVPETNNVDESHSLEK